MQGLKSPHLYFTTSIIGISVIAGIIYFELTGLKPCPMCLLQQYTILIISILAFIATIHRPKTTGIRIYSFVLGTLSLFGALIALKQIQIEFHPTQYKSNCQAGINSFFDNFPFIDFLKSIFTSNPDCAQIEWQLFSLSMATYSFIIFILLSTIHFWQFIFYKTSHSLKEIKTEG